ncbi:hypothetical protein [Massilia sp. X63]|uniref:hypothetical protein n=1 Tax=Massilia sp. X63 TaxID=3237285 RepID=UPI0034DD26D5
MKGHIVMLLPIPDGPNAVALGAWLDTNMPELAAELDGTPYANKRARLNALTGAQVRSCDTIEDGSARFLAALQDLTGEV